MNNQIFKRRHSNRDYIDSLPVRETKANAYGTVISEDDLPVICGHGGSMWLCNDCAGNLVNGLPIPKKGRE